MDVKSKALNTRQAANYLKELGTPFSGGTLEVWRCQGRGPRYRRICRRVVYTPEDLERFSVGQIIETTDSLQ